MLVDIEFVELINKLYLGLGFYLYFIKNIYQLIILIEVYKYQVYYYLYSCIVLYIKNQIFYFNQKEYLLENIFEVFEINCI